MCSGKRLRLILVAVLFFGVGVNGQDEPVIIVDSTIVVLNAVVSDRAGRHVSGLTQKDFTVLEDGAVQEISFFTAEQTPFAAAILVDTSGSMENRIILARAAAIKFLEGLRPTDNAAIYSFDSKVALVQPFANTRDVSERLFELKAKGMTVLNDAIYEAAAELGKRPEKRRAIVILSDGMDTMSRRSEEKSLKAALAANAVIYTVDMSAPDSDIAQRKRNQAALKKFAERSGGTFVAAPGGSAMREAFRNIVDEIGRQYTLGYEPGATVRDGKWHDLEVRISRPGLTIRTRKGYVAAKGK